jgi:hypothetical protein
MNIESKGHQQWMLEVHAAVKASIGIRLPRKLVKRMADELTEEWFRGTPPQRAAERVLMCLSRQAATEASAQVAERKVA